MNKSDVDVCTANIIQNNNLATLTVDCMENEIVFNRHFAQSRGLNCFGPLASVVRFKPVDELSSHVVEKKLPCISVLDT